MQAVVHSADVQDRDGGVLLLATLFGRFPYLARLFADGAYQGPIFAAGLAKILSGVKLEIVKRSDQAKGHCHVDQFYLSMARRAYGPHAAKSMACRVREWRWTPPESAILGRRDNAR
jgi:hypothetical protein